LNRASKATGIPTSPLLDPSGLLVETIISELRSQKIKVKEVDIHDHRQHGERRVTFRLKYKKGNLIRFPIDVTERIGELPGIQETHWRVKG
jgi:hypothetical protein